jgi:hypothetical protein
LCIIISSEENRVDGVSSEENRGGWRESVLFCVFEIVKMRERRSGWKISSQRNGLKR